MGNRQNRRSGRLETPSPERGTDRIQVETPNTGNITLTNPDTVVQEGLGEGNSREQLVEPSQVSNEIQAWTEIFEQKNNDRITKMREEMENKLDASLMEIKTSKSTSLTTNPRSEMNEIESMQPSGSKGKKSMVANASDNESIDSENEDIPLKASEMRDLRHPAKPIHQNDTTLDATVIFNEESDEEDYHTPGNFNALIFPCRRQLLSSCFKESSKFWRQFQAAKLCKFQYASVLILNAAETSTILPPFQCKLTSFTMETAN